MRGYEAARLSISKPFEEFLDEPARTHDKSARYDGFRSDTRSPSFSSG
jgi:hypothetical protein